MGNHLQPPTLHAFRYAVCTTRGVLKDRRSGSHLRRLCRRRLRVGADVLGGAGFVGAGVAFDLEVELPPLFDAVEVETVLQVGQMEEV
jgi:hypothetical protein